MESQSQLRDAVDKHYITEATRLELDALAVAALQEVTGLMEYLQSPEALRNARRARERRIASAPERLANVEPRTREPRTFDLEPRTPEPGTELEVEREPRRDPKVTRFPRPPTPDHPEHEPRTQKAEA